MWIRWSFLFAVILIVAALITGCSTIEIKKDYLLNKQSGKGVIILSTTETGKHLFVKPYLCLRKIGEKHGKELLMWDRRFIDTNQDIAPLWLDWLAPNIPDQRAVGNLHAVELPAGSYEFYSWIATACYPNMTVTYSPKEYFSWKFTVEAGVAKYFGNVNFHNIKVDFGHNIVTINDDMRQRDLKLVGERYPNLLIGEITTEILKKSDGNNNSPM